MKKTLDEMIAVMQAAKEGKKIEYLSPTTNNWYYIKNPYWNWYEYDYRIKPEEPKPEYVPYENAEEFLQAQKEHGPYLKGKYMYHYPLSIDDGGITILNCNNEYETYLFNDEEDDMTSVHNMFSWSDGTPCEKLKQ